MGFGSGVPIPSVILVHVVRVGAGLVAQPDAVVLHLVRALVEELVDGEQLAATLLGLAELFGLCVVPCPISLLRLSQLRFVDSEFPGDSLWTGKLQPLNLRLCLSQTL